MIITPIYKRKVVGNSETGIVTDFNYFQWTFPILSNPIFIKNHRIMLCIINQFNFCTYFSETNRFI